MMNSTSITVQLSEGAAYTGGEPITYPLGVEVWRPKEGWLEGCGWAPSEPNKYAGRHGLQ